MKTLLDTTSPAPVDPVKAVDDAHRQLITRIVDAASADEALRRDLLDKLTALGTGKRGQLPARGRREYVSALHAAGFKKGEIVEIIERLYDVSERQIERDLSALEKPPSP